jgi:hypothetical protein
MLIKIPDRQRESIDDRDTVIERSISGLILANYTVYMRVRKEFEK